MGWESRKGKLYYYRCKREGNRVVKEYVGTGLLGELAAKMDALSRETAEIKRRDTRDEREALAQLDMVAGELYAATNRLTRAALGAAGYHQHNRGEWRRWRDGKREDQGDSAEG